MANDQPSTSPPAPAASPSPAGLGDWPTRVLALVPLVALALLWSNHHLGLGGGWPALTAAIAVSLPVAVGLIAKLLDKAEQETVSARFREFLARVITWRLLLVLYLVLVAVATTLTSIVVSVDEGTRTARAGLSALDAPGSPPWQLKGAGKDELARFVVPTGPFGRPFRLTVDGYVPQTIEAFPPLGVRLRPGRDLRRSPSVLLRFSELAVGSWREVSGGELRIVELGATGEEALLLQVTKPVEALLLGRDQPVPAMWVSNWRMELLAAQVTDEYLLARQLVAWRRPPQFQPVVGLQPGMRLRATLMNVHKKVVAQADFILGKDELQDEAMEDR
jgi:hypothetical protein